MGEALVIPIDDSPEGAVHAEKLVYLLLVLDDGKGGTGLCRDSLQLRRREVRPDANRNPSERLGCELCRIPLGCAVADNRAAYLKVRSRVRRDRGQGT